MENLENKLPREFCKRMQKDLGENYEKYIEAINKPAVRGLRVNTKKVAVDTIQKRFELKLQPISYEKNAFVFDSEEKIGSDVLHQAGLIYMQEPSSMIPVASSGISGKVKVLDLCASPGGKTGQIACHVDDESLIVSNEIVKARADVLYSNVERQGFKNVVITNESPEDLLVFENFFDYVFVDAPCSGEGMFRKNPETIGEWSEENVAMCSARQKEILSVAERLVKAGGILVYSTCTFAPAEDEAIVEWFLKNFNFVLKKPSDEVLKSTLPSNAKVKNGEWARKFYPFCAEGEGQFVAVFENTDDDRFENLHTKKHFRSIERAGKTEWLLFEELVKTSLSEKPKGQLYHVGDNLFLAPEMFDGDLQTAFDRLKFNTLGVKIGTIEKGRLIPNHYVFMAFDKLFIHRHEVDDTNLKKYLHGEELFTNLSGKGFAVITHEGYVVGGAKLVNGRLKNLYPKGLRI